ncbi:Uncharacterized protein FWK35_00012962 [Aphis craccivora]|uniref:Uncharacterized protein n=1 Tax=Aphis craccivora TaxID=307492 RepID=A0A6G0YKC3_APHCR|nr:Uncharacterized protein FWK35_00012962 [Aphis craccivora]
MDQSLTPAINYISLTTARKINENTDNVETVGANQNPIINKTHPHQLDLENSLSDILLVIMTYLISKERYVAYSIFFVDCKSADDIYC